MVGPCHLSQSICYYSNNIKVYDNNEGRKQKAIRIYNESKTEMEDWKIQKYQNEERKKALRNLNEGKKEGTQELE